MKLLVTSCMKDLDSIKLNQNRKPCAARPKEQWNYQCGKFRRAVGVKIAIEVRKRSNTAEEF